MAKKSFVVGFVTKDGNHVIFGVTSIHPNMNGVLFTTEHGDYQVESSQMTDGILGNMYIEYTDLEPEEYMDEIFYGIHEAKESKTPKPKVKV